MRQLMLPASAAAATLAASPALAHVAGTEAGGGWNDELWVPLCLAVAAALYALGRWRMPARSGLRPQTEAAAFVLGMLTLVLALESPIDTIAEQLFSVHMVQHLLLMLVAAPLFVWSRPVTTVLWTLPRTARRAVGRWWATGTTGRLVAWLAAPLSVWSWFCGLFVFWHLPVPYAWALTREPVHVLEHLCFFVSAFAFWAVVIEPSGRRRLDYGATMLFVATAAILSGLPGALMVLTGRPFYAIHAAGAARWGLTALEDQQLAGLIMWIPAGFAYLLAVLVLLALWLREADRRAARLGRLAASGPALLVLVALLSGCGPRKVEQSQAQAAPTGVGNPREGARQIAEVGCGSCHTIPGITGADAVVGPPLTRMGRRIYVAGLLRNTPDNLVAWLMDPQRIVPGNVMPNMHLQEAQARDIAAYLYTLR
ncbi:MAG: cytochrome c oxidase assembly protein [Dongiaceae bacterium]